MPWSLEDCPQKNVNRWKNISLDVNGYADGFASEVLFEKYTKACTGGKMRREMSGVSLMLQAFDGKHPCRLNVVRHCKQKIVGCQARKVDQRWLCQAGDRKDRHSECLIRPSPMQRVLPNSKRRYHVVFNEEKGLKGFPMTKNNVSLFSLRCPKCQRLEAPVSL